MIVERIVFVSPWGILNDDIQNHAQGPQLSQILVAFPPFSYTHYYQELTCT